LSLIICYIGSKGAVIAGDKRRIGFMGDKDKREHLEEELYSGSIKTKESLIRRANELDIPIKINDDASKVKNIGDVLMGEVKSSTPFETKRKRIYATTGSYNILELSGSTIKKMDSGDTSIVVFGNKITKELANKSIKKNWKKKTSLQEVAEVFKIAMEEVSKKTPSVSREYEVILKHPHLNKKESRELLRNTILQDVKDLEKYRVELKEQMDQVAKGIEMTNKILNNGIVGKVTDIKGDEVGIILSEGVEALDMEWNIKAKPGEVVTMEMEEPDKITLGDMVVIQDENLCVMPSKCGLKCEVILCKADKKDN
jgi:hypothetical protein